MDQVKGEKAYMVFTFIILAYGLAVLEEGLGVMDPLRSVPRGEFYPYSNLRGVTLCGCSSLFKISLFHNLIKCMRS